MSTLEKRIQNTIFQLFINRHARSAFIADIAAGININIVPQDPNSNEVIIDNDGSSIFIGQAFENRSDEDLTYALLHNLYHIALLHSQRRGVRDLETWNKACDYIINNALHRDGYTTDMEVLLNPSYDKHTEESLYEIILVEDPPQDGNGGGGAGSGLGGASGNGNGQGNGQGQGNGNGNGNNQGQGQNNNNNNGGGQGQGSGGGNKPPSTPNKLNPNDIPPSMPEREKAKMNSVVSNAVNNHKGDKSVGNMFGELEQLFKSQEVSEKGWEQYLHEFMEDAFGEWDIDYSKPNRRFSEFYIPSWTDETKNIKSINFYIDTSGSVSDDSVQRYISEIAYIKSLFKPDILTIKCFDTRIGRTEVFEEHDEITEFQITGRGGTCLECVRKDIDETKPVCAVIFSDLYCAPMSKPEHDLGVLYVQYDDEDNYADHTPIIGKKIHFKTI